MCPQLPCSIMQVIKKKTNSSCSSLMCFLNCNFCQSFRKPGTHVIDIAASRWCGIMCDIVVDFDVVVTLWCDIIGLCFYKKIHHKKETLGNIEINSLQLGKWKSRKSFKIVIVSQLSWIGETQWDPGSPNWPGSPALLSSNHCKSQTTKL